MCYGCSAVYKKWWKRDILWVCSALLCRYIRSSQLWDCSLTFERICVNAVERDVQRLMWAGNATGEDYFRIEMRTPFTSLLWAILMEIRRMETGKSEQFPLSDGCPWVETGRFGGGQYTFNESKLLLRKHVKALKETCLYLLDDP